eukprot:gnl/TRDRNA2_/TRDRNA2_31728_c0_seq1.p1 gnl/TRDRNA2_/TRDRNA2_31728_c0~~gnl/TRDRNA2_/TRDRNA2_31728_c0_seq1.p1  ORF type:complete len:246 (+),score=35.92 gnl/TRDRNA2_/TRDRNA2_31728_c0_seq1:55-792(+)
MGFALHREWARPCYFILAACVVVIVAEDAQSGAGQGQQEATGLKKYIFMVFEFLQTSGWPGILVLHVFFMVWVLLTLPSTPIELSIGFLYGPIWGSIYGSTCKTGGSTVAFLLGRALGRRYGWKVPEALDSKLGALREAPVLTMIGIRIAPLPLGVKNYGLALTDVGCLQYCIAALVVNTPFSIMWCSAGAACTSLSEAINFDSSKSPIAKYISTPVVVGIVAVLGGAFVLKRALSSKEDKTKTQ